MTIQNNASLPVRLKKLGEKLNKEYLAIFNNLGLGLEPKWIPLCLYLIENNSASINEISYALGLTHPAIIQLVGELSERTIVEDSEDKDDKRKRIISLSAKGKELITVLLPILKDIDDTIAGMEQSLNFNLSSFLSSFENEINGQGISKRIIKKYKKQLMESVEILRYSSRYKNDFKNLNYEWLNKYFGVEEYDEKILSNPEEMIIKQGGEIFFARIDNEIVGTCAAIKADDETFELAKMAVTEKARGRQAGKKLVLAVIGFAYSNGAKAVILDTNIQLEAAIRLYKSIGFKTVPGSFSTNYNRPLFRMKLDL